MVIWSSRKGMVQLPIELRCQTIAAPPTETVMAMAELVLNQSLGADGRWRTLTPEEFQPREQILADLHWRPGPAPQVLVYR